MVIRPATPQDLLAVLDVHRLAFGEEDEADLVEALLADPSAQPVISLLAQEVDVVVGHVLLTSARVEGFDASDVQAMLLAPLAVIPEEQGRGVGRRLAGQALDLAREDGVALVFVLGHPYYYPRVGFTPAGVHGLHAPYPIPAKDADAWMVIDLSGAALGAVAGQVRVADALMKPEYWRE